MYFRKKQLGCLNLITHKKGSCDESITTVCCNALYAITRRMNMKLDNMTKILISFACVFLMISFSACNTTSGGVHIGWGAKPEKSRSHGWKKPKKGGPPPHAPAHGYRSKYAYRYYPDCHVYYDAHREVYFHLRGDSWRMSVSLPQDIRLQVSNYVTIEMDTDRPYTRFKEHKRKYPPGKMKKNKKRKWPKNS